MQWKRLLPDLLFPPRCALCGTRGVRGFCADCEKRLPYADVPLCTGAGFSRCASTLLYEGELREAILRFKFYGGQSAAEGFGELMARTAAEEFAGEFDLVTYVPVSRKRLRERGYDQSRLLAKEMAKHWDAEVLTLLRKTRHNPPQSTLKSAAARRGNVLGVYEAAETETIRGARILLVDDIFTTGATLAECVRVLKDAGAKEVLCLTLARAVTAEK
ncbi:MAG: ComF family protein [Oscillospiraceae bacterium]|nr:ComF family protein [Oscillospiraceae bacterium]